MQKHEKPVTHFTIPIRPVTKKNHQQILSRGAKCPRCGQSKGHYISQSEVYKQYETDCLRIITGIYRLGINQPVNVKSHYYVPNNRRIDLNNLHSALHDVLVKAGVLKDDNRNIIVSTDGSRVFVDKENPRTEVWIEIM